jgi:ribosomal protein L11 methyltransferase
MDPGMAFGTGLHPTTRLCLAAIDDLAGRGGLDGARVLDVGCGSGILALTALAFGAREAFGVDIDPIAIESTDANARLNGFEARVRVREGSLPSGAAPFDLVLANLIAGVLVPLAPDLAGELRPGGRVVASGIFIDREAEVLAAFQASGLEVGERSAEGDWVALVGERPA